MKRLKKWIEKHLFLVWIISSGLFAFIIHCLFSQTAPNEWMAAKWSAGDILTFVSTEALGLLAVWQNKKFKEENDISQQRLEKLTRQANELAVVSKIIEIEADNLSRLRDAFSEFSAACDPQLLSAIFINSTISENPMQSVFTEMASAEKRIDDSFFALSRELKTDIGVLKNDKNPVKQSVCRYYGAAKDFIEKSKDLSVDSPSKEVKMLATARDDYIEIREGYLSHRTKILNLVIYGNISLDEIRKLYHSDLDHNQESKE